MLDDLWPMAKVTSECYVRSAVQWAQSHVFSASFVAQKEQHRVQSQVVWGPGPSFCSLTTWSQASHIISLILNSLICATGIKRLTWEIFKNPISLYFSTGNIWHCCEKSLIQRHIQQTIKHALKLSQMSGVGGGCFWAWKDHIIFSGCKSQFHYQKRERY